jgi:hypothetical protein
VSTRPNAITAKRIQIQPIGARLAYALRAHARGDEPDEVARAIAAYRPDKSNPHYYAQHTVEKAIAAVNRAAEFRPSTEVSGPER